MSSVPRDIYARPFLLSSPHSTAVCPAHCCLSCPCRPPQISAEVRELAQRARDNKLMPDDYMGGSFSVSNLGMFGLSSFCAIINPPQVPWGGQGAGA